MTLLAAAMMMSACHKDRPAPQPLIDPASRTLFNHIIVDPAPPGGPECCTDVLAVGDINGDGYADAVIGSQEARGAALVWYEYPTWRRHDIARGEFTTDGQLSDLDRDGDLDIVVGELNEGVLWYEQSSAGGSWTKHVIGAGYAHDLAVADVDSDGRPDVVVADKKGVHIFFLPDGRAVRRAQIIERKGEGLQVADLDRDGDPDLVYSNAWLEQRRDAGRTEWRVHEIDPSWNSDTRIQLADLNDDGRLDVILSGSEGDSPLAWFEAPAADSPAAPWSKHAIGEGTFVGVHTLRAADFDLDGDVDLFIAEMSTSPRKRVEVLLNRGRGIDWETRPLAMHGSHNAVAADVDADGDVDVLGKNYSGAARFIEYWENRSADLRLVPAAVHAGEQFGAGWSYDPIDVERPPQDARKFGLLSSDLDRDGHSDVIAGGTVYLNPGSSVDRKWRRVLVAPRSDVIHVTARRHNDWPSLLAVSADALESVEATTTDGTRWATTKLHDLPSGRTQGHAATARSPGGEYDFYFTHHTTAYRLHVTGAAPRQWRLNPIRQDVQEEGIAVGDLDGNGVDDVVLVDGDGRRLLWLEADERGRWRVQHLGASLHWIDRVAIADIDGDRRPDVVYSEETRDWDYNARLVWLKSPADPRRLPWAAQTVAVLRSINSLEVLDIDADGDPDLIAAEHTDMRPGQLASDNFTGIFWNSGGGTFVTEVVEIGPHSSHLGAQLLDTGAPAPLQIVSVGWEQACCVHRWIRARHGPGNSPQWLNSDHD